MKDIKPTGVIFWGAAAIAFWLIVIAAIKVIG